MGTTTKSTTFALALAALLAGCSTGDAPTPIDCTWFAADNCWKETAAAAVACTDQAAIGTFNGDTTTCTYADGTSLAFATAANVSQSSDQPWSFAITSASGTTCLEYRETDDSRVVKTSLGTYREDTVGLTWQITCPDGNRYEIGALDALGCDWSTLPGYASTSSGGTISFALLGTSLADASLWSCTP
jgi:hypothetical protein